MTNLSDNKKMLIVAALFLVAGSVDSILTMIGA